MNSTKNKLFAAIAMLIVAAVAMTGTSFAWFTISTAPRVDNLEVSMSATRNFEIAAIDGDYEDRIPSEPAIGDAAAGQTRWGATVSFTSSAPLVFPMTETTAGLRSVYYDDTGRVDDFRALSLGAFNTSGVAYYFADISSNSAVKQNVTCGAVYGVWLRLNGPSAENVTVSYPSITTLVKGNGDPLIAQANAWPTSDDITRLASAVAVSVEVKQRNEDGSYTNVSVSNKQFAMTPNLAYKVLVTVYFDGEYIYARDIANGLKASDFDIEFISNTTLGTKTGTDYFGADNDYTPLQTYGN